MSKTSLKSAVSKVRRHAGNVWCGYLVPAEIVVLADSGATPTLYSHVSMARQKVAKGEADPTWFYFIPSADLRNRIVDSSKGKGPRPRP